MIKLLHGADFHLDSAFSALTPTKAAQRRREQRDALKKLEKECDGCDLVLLAGDLFDSAHIYQDTLEALQAFFSSLSAEIFIAPGNHDYVAAGSPYLTVDWGENVHIFTSSAIEKVHIDRLNCDVYGAGFTSMEMPSMLKDFRVEDPHRLNVMVLHAELQANSSYNPISPEAVAASGLDYLALGHVHSACVQKFGHTLCAYSGCLMGRGFDECGEKGVLRAELSKEGCKTTFLPLAPWKYEILTVEVGEDPLASIQNALPANTEKDSYRIILTGEANRIDCSFLEQQLAPAFFSLSVRDRTSSIRELWAGEGEDTLRGHFLRELKSQYENSDAERKQKILQAAKLVSALMDGREVSL